MKIKIIFNTQSADSKFSCGWGLSCLIDDRILFDTGEKGEYLIDNINKMNIDISSIEAVVISHDHWDHTGGLRKLLKRKQDLIVYGCPRFSDSFKENVKFLGVRLEENSSSAEIYKNIYVTGEISGTYKELAMPEQAAIIKTDNGLTVITGCAHPGIVRVLEVVREKFPKEQLYLVFGGFHLINESQQKIKAIVNKFKEFGVRRVGPTHCSGQEAEKIFRQIYGDGCISVKMGEVITI